MRSWAILGFDEHIICSKHNIGGKGCNYKFNNLFLSVWYVIEFGHLSMHTPHLQPLPIMGLGHQWNLDFANPLNLTSQHN
jgi:hypothetical protein